MIGERRGTVDVLYEACTCETHLPHDEMDSSSPSRRMTASGYKLEPGPMLSPNEA